jgi:dienelactone hydrolase
MSMFESWRRGGLLSVLTFLVACGPEGSFESRPELEPASGAVGAFALNTPSYPTGVRISVNIPNAALGHTLSGFLYLPANMPTGTNVVADPGVPAIVFLHGCNGLYSAPNNTTDLKRVFDNESPNADQQGWAQRAMNAGFAALFVDSFSSRGIVNGGQVSIVRDGQTVSVPITKGICKEGSTYPGDDVLYALGVEETTQRPQDAVAAHDFLATVPGIDMSRVGVLGWSHGGSTTLALLANSNIWTNTSGQTLTGPAPLYNTGTLFKVGYAFYPGCGLQTRNGDGGALDPTPATNYGGITNSRSTWIPNVPFRMVMGTADSLLENCQDHRMPRAKLLALAQAPVSDAYPANVKHSFDEAFAVSTTFTAADVAAKAQYDLDALDFLSTHLQGPPSY